MPLLRPFSRAVPVLAAAVWMLALAAPARAVDPVTRANLDSADRFLRGGRPDMALKIYDQVLVRNPVDPVASVGKAQALIALERYDAADSSLAAALERVEPKTDLYRVRAELRVAQDRLPEAYRDVLRVMALDEDRASWAFRQTRDYLKQGLKPDQAAKLADQAASEHPDLVSFDVLKAVIEVLGERSKEALERIERADDDRKLRGRAVARFADEVGALGFPDVALAALRSAVDRTDNPAIRTKLLFRVADIEENRGEYRAAVASLDRIVKERPGTTSAGKALLMSADLYQQHLDDPEGALAVYARIKDDPMLGHRRPEMLLQMGECYLRLGRFEEAADTYAQVIPEAIDPEDAERAAYELAEVEFFRGNPDSAKTLYQDMAENNPRSLLADDAAGRYILLNKYGSLGGGAAVQSLGRLEWSRQVGDSAAVDSVAGRILAVYPQGELGAEALLARAEVKVAGGNPAAAVADLDTLVARNPDDLRAPTALKRAGDLLTNRLDRPRDGLERYERILTDYPGSLEAPEARRIVEALRRDIKL